MNKSLGKDEKPWRLPTVAEWEEIFRPYRIAKGNVDAVELDRIATEIRQKFNLQLIYKYWADYEFPDDSQFSGNAKTISALDGRWDYGRYEANYVQLVR